MLTIILAVVVVIAAVLIYAASRPGSFSVARATSIRAAPAAIFPLIADFHQWPAWSPWEKMDPAMTRTHSGAASGKGAVYEWNGNNKVGAGRMEITDTTPPLKVAIKLDFFRPMKGNNQVEFTLAPKGDSTEVRWEMTCSSPYLGKLMGIFMNMDKMIGKDFEAGLANMKALAEQ